MNKSLVINDITFNLDDGSSMQGKETILSFLKEVYSKMDILDYQVGVNLSVVGDNGDQWVLLWDNATVVTETGEKSAFAWMEAFMFEGDKIIFMNQFSKPVKQ